MIDKILIKIKPGYPTFIILICKCGLDLASPFYLLSDLISIICLVRECTNVPLYGKCHVYTV